MKKIAALLITCSLALSLLTACGAESSETVAVRKVRDIVSEGSIALVSRYAGIVVSGESAEIKKDADMKILTVNVSEGDMVKKGDVLFSYDTEAMQLKMEKLHLEYAELQNKKASAEENIPVIQKKLRYANATDQLGYNLQIQTLEADILESTYNMSIKEREIAALESAMENVDVTAPIAGRVMSVHDSDDPAGTTNPVMPEGQGASGTDAFITITDVGTYRIKGTINEMNVGALREGMPVIIRSRLDESVTWSGTLDKIDWENTVSSSNNNYYYMSGDEMTTTTKYPFYVSLDDYTGLLLGQHIYIEPDYGQAASRQGLWLPEYYIVREGNDAWVWAQGNRSRLEKRTLTLGETDDETGTVQVFAGLTGDESIAFPEEGLHAGMTCIAYEDTMFVDPSDLPVSFEEDDAFAPEEFNPEEMPDIPFEEMPETEEPGFAETPAGTEEEPVSEGGAG